jgi:poly(A) polymerase
VPDQQSRQREPVVVPRNEHLISRANISDNALKVLYRLHNAGYAAYLVGGGVRDLSLGREPKDFDVATDATPEDVRDLFRNCRLIGRRFRLAHVHFGREIIEVATFRALHGPGEDESNGDGADRVVEDGLVLRDNVFGTIEEDALRRDFTVNALYYNIGDFSVVDYTGGMADLERGVIRLIGDPEQRYREDPVRMLRAVRFAVKLGFRIEPATAEPVHRLGGLLSGIPAARLFEEILKLFLTGQAQEAFEMLRHYGLFGYLFPATEDVLARDDSGQALAFIADALSNTDRRIAEDKPVTPAFLFGALLWPVVRERTRLFDRSADSYPQALQQATADVVDEQIRTVTIPKRFGLPMREIWHLQPRFERRGGNRAKRLAAHPRFRAAYDFLLLRSGAGEVDRELADWWTEFQNTSGAGAAPAQADAAPPRRRRRRRGGRRNGGGGAPGNGE